VHEVAGEITVHVPTTVPVEASMAVTVKLVGIPPVPTPVPNSMITDPFDTVSVSVGASGTSGTQTAKSDVFTTGVIVSLGSIRVLPVDQASNVKRFRVMPDLGATVTVVLGATI
jgi:hypothetical protein